MTSLLFLLAAVVGQAPRGGGDAADLVRRLGAARFEERREAEAAIESLGEEALPALRQAAHDLDPERRERSARLLERLEPLVASRTLSRAAMIRLDFVGRPLDEVVDAFGGPSFGRLAFHPETPAGARARRIDLHAPGPLPFWTALDRLCEAGDLHYVPGSKGGFGSGDLPHFRFYMVPGRIDCPHADSGPFRLELIGISYGRSINLVPNPPAEGPFFGREMALLAYEQGTSSFEAELRLVVEPRMLLELVGAPIVTEAIDDLGQSLLPPAGPNPEQNGGNRIPAQASYPLTLRHLRRPVRPGSTIRRLRVTIPAVVVARRPEPLVIPLPGGVGKSFRHGETTITVDSVEKRDTQGHPHVRLRLETGHKAPSRLRPPGDPAREADMPTEPMATANVLEVLDDQGRLFPFVAHRNAPHPATGRAEADLMLWPEGGMVVPEQGRREAVPYNREREWTIAELRHYELARDVLIGTFEFRDLPLP